MSTQTCLRIVCFILIIPRLLNAQSPAKNLMGFAQDKTAAQFKLEEQFDNQLKASNLDQWMKRLSARPHHVGSPYDRDNAFYIADLFKSWGYETRIDSFFVLFPTPKVRLLEMLSPVSFKAALQEKTLKEDGTSGQNTEQLPTYNAFSCNGDVSAELVFVNYGIPKDYDELERRGIDVKGKIVIAKYGGSWRGIKPKVAAEKGAIGCLIYSDPKDDGYFQGDEYPKGAYKNDNMAQRGSVADMPVYPGDALTPGYGATANAPRLDISAAPTITKIPVLPISWGDALPLLKALEGPMAPESWRGALPIPYHLGAGPAKVHLKLEFDYKIRPVYDVIAVMKGSEFPDEWIIRGNHHDAWVNGANDPISGLVALMEEARSISELSKSGWKPRRTLVFCAWDGEEPGLLGSTEWAETNEKELGQHAVVYFNTDSNARGFLDAGGTHTLEKFFNQVGRDVMDPQKGVSVNDRLRANIQVNGAPEEQKEVLDRPDLRIDALGSGSDYSPFFQHLGIPAMNIGYGGESSGGEYHSIFDSYDDYVRFKDPGFAYGIALSKTMGRCLLRFANAEVLPFEYKNFSNTLGTYLADLKKGIETMRTETDRQNRLIKGRLYDLASNATNPLLPPKAYDPVPYLNFSPLENALARLDKSAVALDTLFAKALSINSEKRNELNGLLRKSEHALSDPDGLPRRPWYRNLIYAPGFYTGYGVKTLPGAREAIEQRSWEEAEKEMVREAAAINRLSDMIDRMSDMLK